MSDFSDFLLSQTSPDAGASFSSKAPRPYVDGVSTNVLQGSVNTGWGAQTYGGGFLHVTLPGMQSATVQQAAMSLYGLSTDEIKTLQGQLVAGGFMSSKDITTPGMVDGATAKAYGDLLQNTSAMNMAGNASSISDVLSQAGAARAAAGLTDVGNTANGHVQQITPGLDLIDQVQQAAHAEYGRKLKPAEAQKFVALYHRMEGSQNSQMLAASTAAQGGTNSTVVGAPTASTSATAFVDDLHPAEAQAHSVAGQFGNLLDLLKGI